jgi:hypothetical protein
MTVILKSYDGREWRLDTPDSALIGLWLKVIFDEQAGHPERHGGPPVGFSLEIR